MKAKFFLPLILFVLIISSCDKDDPIEAKPETPTKPTTLVKTKAEKIDSLKQEVEKQGNTIISETVEKDSSKIVFQVSSKVNGADEYAIFSWNVPEVGIDDFFTGRIINGNTFLKDGRFGSLMNYTMQKNQDVLIVGGNGNVLGKETLSELSNTDVKNAKSKILANTGETLIDQNQSELILKIADFTKYSDISDSILFNKNSLLAEVAPNNFLTFWDSDPIPKPTGVYAFFRQDHYTIKIDTSGSNWRLLSKDFHDSIYVKKDPVFMSSVTYGRYGLLTVESDAPASTLKEILSIALKDFNRLSDSQKDILKNSTTRYLFFGPNGYKDLMHNDLSGSSIGRVEYFSKAFNDKKFGYNSFGYVDGNPTFFTLSTIRGNQLYASTSIENILEFEL